MWVVYAIISVNSMPRAFAVWLVSCALVAQQPIYLILLKGANAVAYYTPDGKMIASVAVGLHPHEMAFSPDRRMLYTVDNGTMRIENSGTGGNTLSVIDVAAKRKIGDISLGEYRRPHGIDVDPSTGNLVVTAELPDKVLLVDANKRTVIKHCDTKGKTSHMVSFGPGAKYAYVSNLGSGNISAVNLASCAVKLIQTGERPEGSALSRDGKELYVCNREAASITVIDTAKNQAIAYIPTGKGPVRIAITPDGSKLVYALMHEKKVAFANPQERRQTDYVLLPFGPVSLTLSPDGQLAFASAEEQDTVYIISVAKKRIVGTIQTEKGAAPDPVLMQ